MDNLNQQFSLIYDQYIEKIYRFVYVKVNVEAIAQDITSRVFTKGWETYQKGTKIDNIGAFLYQIARNMVVDYYRQKGRTQMVSPEDLPELADSRPGLFEKAILSADIAMVKNAIQDLSKDYQDVLILHYLEDMPTEDIALIMDRPAGTVRVMIHRGLTALKEKLVQES